MKPIRLDICIEDGRYKTYEIHENVWPGHPLFELGMWLHDKGYDINGDNDIGQREQTEEP